MKTTELRWYFTKRLLPELFFFRDDLWMGSINNDGVHGIKTLLHNLWKDLCSQDGDHPNNHPLEFEAEIWTLDENDINENHFLMFNFQELKKEKNLAIFAGLYFGKKLTQRYFIGETSYEASGSFYIPTGHMGRLIFLIEMTPDGEEWHRNNYGYFFGETPAEEQHVFISKILEICNDGDDA